MNPTEKDPSITYPLITYNFIMNAILGAANFLFPLIVTPYVSRILLPEGTGKVAFAASLIAYFNLFAQLGVPVYGIHACARVRDDRDALTRMVHELLAVSPSMSMLAYTARFFSSQGGGRTGRCTWSSFRHLREVLVFFAMSCSTTIYMQLTGDMERFHRAGRKVLHFVFLIDVPLAVYFMVFAAVFFVVYGLVLLLTKEELTAETVKRVMRRKP